MAKLTYSLHISMDGAEPVPLSSLSDTEKEDARQKMARRLGDNMSRYYTQHAAEFERLCRQEEG